MSPESTPVVEESQAIEAPEEAEGQETFGVLPGGEDDPKFGQPEPEAKPAPGESAGDDEGTVAPEPETPAAPVVTPDDTITIDEHGNFNQPYAGKYKTVADALKALDSKDELLGKQGTELEKAKGIGDDERELLKLIRTDPMRAIERIQELEDKAQDEVLDFNVRLRNEGPKALEEVVEKTITRVLEKKQSAEQYTSGLKEFYNRTSPGSFEKLEPARRKIEREIKGYQGENGNWVQLGHEELLHLAAIGFAYERAKLTGDDKPARDQLISGPERSASTVHMKPKPKPNERSEEDETEALLNSVDRNMA